MIDLNELTKYESKNITTRKLKEVRKLISNEEYYEQIDLITLNCELEIDQIKNLKFANISLNVITIAISLVNFMYLPMLTAMQKDLSTIDRYKKSKLFFQLSDLIVSFMRVINAWIIFLVIFILYISIEISCRNKSRYNNLILTLKYIEEEESKNKVI